MRHNVLQEARKIVEHTQYPPEYDASLWEQFPKANCYTYALGLQMNEGFLVGDLIGERVTYKNTKEEILRVLETEMRALGFCIERCDAVEKVNLPNSFKIYVEFSEFRNQYHFYRQDSSGFWSQKAAGRFPINIDIFSGLLISNPETMEDTPYEGYCYLLHR